MKKGHLAKEFENVRRLMLRKVFLPLAEEAQSYFTHVWRTVTNTIASLDIRKNRFRADNMKGAESASRSALAVFNWMACQTHCSTPPTPALAFN